MISHNDPVTLEKFKLLAEYISKEPVRSIIIEDAMKTPYWHLEGYMNRYWMYNPFIDNKSELGAIYPDEPSSRLHHILRADNDRHLHNHPWDAISVIMKGWYKERLEDGSLIVRKEGDVNVINHDCFHRIEEVSEGGVWTFFTTFGYQHPWGFNTEEGFVDSRAYFAKYQTST